VQRAERAIFLARFIFMFRACMQARLSLPSPKAMQAVVDRMKSLGAKHVIVDADVLASELVLKVMSDCVALKSTFRGLAVDSPGENLNEGMSHGVL
jgi:hypothetical protein